MFSSPTSRNENEGSVTYESLGFSSIELLSSEDGVSLVANADGLRSLALLFGKLARGAELTGHVHLTPSMQLTPSSASLVVARSEGGSMPNGDSAPLREDAELDG